MRAVSPIGRSLRGLGVPVACGVALFLVFVCDDADATVLGSLGASLGVLAALVAMLVLKAWPAQTAAGLVSVAMVVVVGIAGTMWSRRSRSAVALPAGISRARLLGDLRALFLEVQTAWDHGDMPVLRSLTLPGLLDEMCTLRPDVCAPERRTTEILELRAELLGFETLAEVDLVSIDFSGLMREACDQPPAPFREVWMLTRARQDRAGWRLARHQALL